MNDSVSVSGLNAGVKAMEASAHNTANLSTDDFGRYRSLASERPGGGVVARADRVDLTPEAREADGSLSVPRNNVSPAEEAVARISARRTVETNLNALRAQNRADVSLIDILA